MGTIPSLFLILTERRYLMGALNVGVDLGVKSSHHAVICSMKLSPSMLKTGPK